MNLRLACRLPRFILHLFLGLALCALVFPWLGSRRRNRHIQRWSAQLLGICAVSVEHAHDAALTAHAVIVANHVSWLDIFVINSLHPARFVAKAEVRGWPLVGPLVAGAGTLFIERGKRRDVRHIFRELEASLRRGERVAFFPEGTTGPQGGLLPFHANLFQAAIGAAVAVQPLALRYVDAGGAPHAGPEYIGDTSFARSVATILSGRPIRALVVALPQLDSAGSHRRDLAQQAHAAVAGALAERS